MLIQLGTKNTILDLVLALQNLPAAHLLPSRNGRGLLEGDLATLFSQLDSNQQEISSATLLLKRIIDNTPDVEVWNTVYSPLTQSTPPPRPVLNIDQTPWLRTTSSLANSSEHRKYIDDVLKDELDPSLYIGIPGFYKAFFGNIRGLKEAAAAVITKSETGDNPLYNKERG